MTIKAVGLRVFSASRTFLPRPAQADADSAQACAGKDQADSAWPSQTRTESRPRVV